jgi:hypothetical protein
VRPREDEGARDRGSGIRDGRRIRESGFGIQVRNVPLSRCPAALCQIRLKPDPTKNGWSLEADKASKPQASNRKPPVQRDRVRGRKRKPHAAGRTMPRSPRFVGGRTPFVSGAWRFVGSSGIGLGAAGMLGA